MLKRVAIMLFCLIMVFTATFGFVVGVVAVPTIYSYAAVNDDSVYVPLREQSDLVKCFQSYCKSRDLTIEGSLADAVTTFTTGAFNSACNELGINITQLQAEIKAEYDNSGKPVKFFLNDTGVMAMNRIFAQFLQDNELDVGDSANQNDNTVYDGYMYGNTLCWIVNGANGWPSGSGYHSSLISYGQPYLYDTDSLVSAIGQNNSYNLVVRWPTNQQSTVQINKKNDGVNGNAYALDGNSETRVFYGKYKPYSIMYNGQYGQIAICYDTYFSRYYGIAVIKNTSTNDSTGNTVDRLEFRNLVELNNAQGVSVNVWFTTNNTTINNNTYEGDTYITNEGDVINEPVPIPPGGTDPGWDIGGGGGTATDGNGNTWNIQFPDFELPDLNIDWSINGLGEKFPFSIPFDLVALVTVLNAEPQAPRFEGTVNFGFTTWDYDINLQQFDSVAQACRIAELLLLVVGLILVTRSIIKG